MLDGKKHCKRCDSFKSLDDFYSNRQRSDGLTTYCKKCHNAITVAARKKNPEPAKAARKRWAGRNPGFKKAADKRYYEKHKDRIKQQSRDQYAANPEAFRERSRQHRASDPNYRDCIKRWSAKNEDKVKAYRSSHRARKANAPGSHTASEWRELLRLCRCHCMGCGRQFSADELTRDHIVPLSLGGSDDITNVMPLCHRCNSSKQAKGPQWYHSKWATINFESRV